jgi:sugar lactone lactonase YvrE
MIVASSLVLLSAPALRAGGLTLTPDGNALLVVGQDGTLNIYSPPTATEATVIRAHRGAAHAVIVMADGKRVITAGEDGVARVWDRQTWKEVATLRGHDKDVYAVAVSPDGTLIATGGNDRTARIWDASTGKERAKLEGLPGVVGGVCFSPDGRYVLTGATEPDDSVRGIRGPHRGTPVRRWDAATGKAADFPAVRGYQFAASRRLIAIGNESMAAIPAKGGGAFVGAQFAVTLVSPNGKERTTVTHCGTGVAFSADGLYLAVTGHGSGWHPPLIVGPASQTRGLAVVDTFDGAEVFTIKSDGGEGAFSPDGRRLAVTGYGPSRFVDLVPKVRPEWVADPEPAWEALAGDGRSAHEALWALVGQGPKAVAWIGERLKPARAIPQDEISGQIRALNSPKFAEREEASKALKAVGPLVVGALREALKAPPSEDVRGRLEQLLAAAEGDTPPDAEARRAARVVAVLDRIDSAEARELLGKLAGGARGAWLTEDADAALRRAKLRAGK